MRQDQLRSRQDRHGDHGEERGDQALQQEWRGARASRASRQEGNNLSSQLEGRDQPAGLPPESGKGRQAGTEAAN